MFNLDSYWKKEHKFKDVWIQKMGSNYMTGKNCIMRNLRVYSSPDVTQVIKLRKVKWTGKLCARELQASLRT
jgi:hypothetical protein